MNSSLRHMGELISRSGLAGLTLAILLALCTGLNAQETKGLTKEKKVLLANVGAVAAITGWGIANWGYFENDPKIGSEGWFSEDSKEGGADKLAHFYFSYTLAHILSGLYDYWEYPTDRAALLGAFSSFAIMGTMELGDSFSNFGFSGEDIVMNTLGCAAGYLLYVNPDLSSKIDFRIEYIAEFNRSDFITDYDNMNFLMAVKLDGFDRIKDTWAKYLELHIGYNARGYEVHDGPKQRNVYVGVGLNISKIFKELSMKKTAKFFNYYQLPYTYLSVDRNLNQ